MKHVKWWLLLHLVPFILTGQVDQELGYAPLAPVEKQYPMGLTIANREFLIENPKELEKERKRTKQLIEEHTFPWLSALFLLGSLGVAWTFYLTCDQWLKHIKPSESPEPQEDALKAIQKLKDSSHEKQNYKETYAELVNILLSVIQKHFETDLKGLTTEELKQKFKNQTAFTLEVKENIISFLEMADEVKFAGKKPAFNELNQSLQKLIALVSKIRACVWY